MNPVSLLELSVQERLIWLAETAVAVKFEGADETGDAVGEGVGVRIGVEAGVGAGNGGPPFTTNLKVVVVASVSASIVPEVVKAERSTVDVKMLYCTAVPAGWAGIVAE